MKKNIIKIFALVLILSMLLPMSAFAATTYSITATLTGPDRYGVTQTVSGTSSKYNTPESSVIAEVISAMGPESYRRELETKFEATGMRPVFDKAVIALSNGSAAWNAYIDSYAFVCDNETFVRDYGATFADLLALGGSTGVNLGEYRVTVTLNTHGTGGGDVTPEQNKDNPVILDPNAPGKSKIEVDGGTVSADKAFADVNGEVTLVIVPDAGKMINYVVVRDEDSNKLPLTYEGNGNFSFKMPESGATVTVTFRTEPAEPNVTGIASILNTDDHVAFMIGDDQGLFRPYDNITRAEVSMIFYRLLRDKTVDALVSFDDVAPDAWYAEAIGTLAALRIVKGVGGGNFEPNRPITRAEFAVICARFAKEIVGGYTFIDVVDYWADDEISTAAAYGWIFGYEDGTFAPDKAISRQEAAAIVNRMLYRLGDQIAIDAGEHRDFPDVNDTMWSWYEIAEATYDHDFEDETTFVHEYWE